LRGKAGLDFELRIGIGIVEGLGEGIMTGSEGERVVQCSNGVFPNSLKRPHFVMPYKKI
jgi:hypothetical protein